MKPETELSLALSAFIGPIVERAVYDAFEKITVAHTLPADEVGGVALAEQVTRLSAARIYTLVSKRAIPHAKRGNRLTFRRSELLAWLDEGHREQKGGPDA